MCKDAVQAMVTTESDAHAGVQRSNRRQICSSGKPAVARPANASLVVIYSYGDFRAATTVVRSDDATGKTG